MEAHLNELTLTPNQCDEYYLQRTRQIREMLTKLQVSDGDIRYEFRIEYPSTNYPDSPPVVYHMIWELGSLNKAVKGRDFDDVLDEFVRRKRYDHQQQLKAANLLIEGPTGIDHSETSASSTEENEPPTI